MSLSMFLTAKKYKYCCGQPSWIQSYMYYHLDVPCASGVFLQEATQFLHHSRQTSLGVCEMDVYSPYTILWKPPFCKNCDFPWQLFYNGKSSSPDYFWALYFYL